MVKTKELYILTRGEEELHLTRELDMLVLEGATSFGLPIFEWLQMGWTVAPGGDVEDFSRYPHMTERIANLIKSGAHIGAIKALREEGNLGLAEAKNIADKYRDDITKGKLTPR